MSRTEYGYIMNFRLFPYVKDFLLKKIKASDFSRVSFDESSNKVLQE